MVGHCRPRNGLSLDVRNDDDGAKVITPKEGHHISSKKSPRRERKKERRRSLSHKYRYRDLFRQRKRHSVSRNVGLLANSMNTLPLPEGSIYGLRTYKYNYIIRDVREWEVSCSRRKKAKKMEHCSSVMVFHVTDC